jgi:hypothetical protein
LLGREHAEDPVGGEQFACGAIDVGAGIIGKGVTGVDLDEVVDDEHPHHPRRIHRAFRMFGEHLGHQRQVPGMLGAVLPAGAIAERCLPKHSLQAIRVDQEGQLVLGANVGPIRLFHWAWLSIMNAAMSAM